MLEFSFQVNYVNKETINTKDFDESSFKVSKSNDGRKKAIEYAKSIKKPTTFIPTQKEFDDERFVRHDNNTYMLENQKIKMLFN